MPSNTREATRAASSPAVHGLAPQRWRAFVRAIETRYPPRGAFVPVEGGRLHYLEKRLPGVEDSHTLVLLHGASGNACDMGMELFDALARRCRVLSFDRPGHGWSDRPGGVADASPAAQGRLIRQALGRLGVESAIIVAHSWAGSLGLHMALRHADIVHGLVLTGAASHPWPGGRVSWYHNLASQEGLGPLFARLAPLGQSVVEPALQTVFQPQKPPPDYVERSALPLLFRPSQFRANAQDMTALHAFLSAQASDYPALAVPVTAIVGEADEIVPMTHGEALARQSSQVELRVLKGQGHMLQHMAVGEIVAAVDALPERVARERLWRRLRKMRAAAQ